MNDSSAYELARMIQFFLMNQKHNVCQCSPILKKWLVWLVCFSEFETHSATSVVGRFFHQWTGTDDPVLFNESLVTANDSLNCNLFIMTYKARIVALSCCSHGFLMLTLVYGCLSGVIVRWKSFQWTWRLFQTCSGTLSKVLYYRRQARKQKHWK